MALQGCLQIEELPGGPCGIHLWMSGDFLVSAVTGGGCSGLGRGVAAPWGSLES